MDNTNQGLPCPAWESPVAASVLCVQPTPRAQPVHSHGALDPAGPWLFSFSCPPLSPTFLSVPTQVSAPAASSPRIPPSSYTKSNIPCPPSLKVTSSYLGVMPPVFVLRKGLRAGWPPGDSSVSASQGQGLQVCTITPAEKVCLSRETSVFRFSLGSVGPKQLQSRGIPVPRACPLWARHTEPASRGRSALASRATRPYPPLVPLWPAP